MYWHYMCVRSSFSSNVMEYLIIEIIYELTLLLQLPPVDKII